MFPSYPSNVGDGDVLDFTGYPGSGTNLKSVILEHDALQSIPAGIRFSRAAFTRPLIQIQSTSRAKPLARIAAKMLDRYGQQQGVMHIPCQVDFLRRGSG